MRGLRIRATLATPVVVGTPDGRLHLDSILAYAAMRPIEHTLPPIREQICVIEIPGLECVWRDAEGRPLWACSDLLPIGDRVLGTEYGHRRYPAYRAHLSKKPSANVQAGQFKEGRRQLRTVWAQQWEAQAIGEASTLQGLLNSISHIGSRASNYGRVLAWEVAEDESVTLETVLDECSVPAQALGDLGLSADHLSPFVAWTPPYWYQPAYADCREPKPCSYPA
jgi:hypothetical protein